MTRSTPLTRLATAMAATVFTLASPLLLADPSAPATQAAPAAQRIAWGYGMNPAMAGPHGMGPRFMMRPYPPVELTPEQEAQLGKIQQDFRMKQWGLMTQMRNEMGKMRGLYSSQTRDDKAIAGGFERMNALRQQMFENMADARKQVQGVFTKEQLDQLRGSPPVATAPATTSAK
jgi:Spy/CpxP family protein refolding chaperone